MRSDRDVAGESDVFELGLRGSICCFVEISSPLIPRYRLTAVLAPSCRAAHGVDVDIALISFLFCFEFGALLYIFSF